MIIKQSSTARALVFLMVDSSDHITGKTGLTPTVTLSKNGAAFASPAGAVTEISAGWYKVAGNATDTNTLGSLALHATGSGADPCDILYEVILPDPDVAAFGAMPVYVQPTGFLAASFPTDPADQSLVIAATDAILTRIGVAGAGLTALGDTRIANLDAAVSSRMATFTLPTNFSAFSITAGGLVTLSPTANVFNGIVPDAAFFTNSSGGGGGGLTAQQTRDAMKLAPSVGAAASGSIDDQLADLQTSVDALSAGSGTGAYIITVTVTDGTDPLQNAHIRVIDGITPYTGTTDVNGEAEFALDAATYSVAVTKAGYQFTPTTRTVTGEEAGTLTNDLEMELVVITPPADPTLCRVYAHLQTKSGVVVQNEKMYAKLLTPAISGALITNAEIESLGSDADGMVYLDLILPSEITPAALTYDVRVPAANFRQPVTPTGATYSLGQLVT